MRPSCKERRNQEDKLARTFSRIMFQGKTNAAIDLLAKSRNEKILKADDRVGLGHQGVKSVLDQAFMCLSGLCPGPAVWISHPTLFPSCGI